MRSVCWNNKYNIHIKLQPKLNLYYIHMTLFYCKHDLNLTYGHKKSLTWKSHVDPGAVVWYGTVLLYATQVVEPECQNSAVLTIEGGSGYCQTSAACCQTLNTCMHTCAWTDNKQRYFRGLLQKWTCVWMCLSGNLGNSNPTILYTYRNHHLQMFT